jgi:hypothetical protein
MRNLLIHTGPARLAAGLGVLAMSGVLAACGSGSPKAAPASAAAPVSISVVAACQALQGWDSSNTTADKSISSQLTGTRAGTDFNRLMRAINGGDAAAVGAAGKVVSSDCGAAGVVVNMTTTVTDPNGKTCQALDASGYCPGDDPSQSASPSPSPAPTMTRQTDMLVFKVWGSGYPSIQYGSDSNSNSPSGGYGPLGDGNVLPWSASLTYDSGALYYALSAQLEGYGDISDSVTEVITTYCSDGSHKTEDFPLASGHSSGGYNIAQAEYAGGDTGNATQAESDAGC